MLVLKKVKEIAKSLYQSVQEFYWNDETPAKQYSELIELFTPIQGKSIPKACFKLPGSTGDFGSDTNPIPVNGVFGEFIYLSRLRTKEKEYHYFYHRLAAFKSNQLNKIIDIYEIVSMDGREWHQLCFCPYYPRRSKLAPEYANLSSWRKMSRIQRFMSRYDMGTDYYVDNFPFGIPDFLRKSAYHKTIGQKNVELMALKAEEILKAFADNYEQSRKNFIKTGTDYIFNVFMRGESMDLTINDYKPKQTESVLESSTKSEEEEDEKQRS